MLEMSFDIQPSTCCKTTYIYILVEAASVIVNFELFVSKILHVTRILKLTQEQQCSWRRTN